MASYASSGFVDQPLTAAPFTPADVPADPPASALAFKGLVAFTAVMLLAPQIMFPQLAVFRPALLTAGIAVGGYVLGRFLRHERLIMPTREFLLSMALVWWAVMTIPASLWPGGSVNLLTDLWLKTLLIFWVIGHVVDTPSRLTRLTWWLAVLAIPLATTGVKRYVTGEFMNTAYVARIEGYDSPLAANPNDLALMLNLLLPLVVGLLLQARTAVRRTVLLVIAGLVAAAIVLTFSRSGFLTLATIVTLYLYRFAREGRILRVAAVFALLAMTAPLLPSSYVDRIATITALDEDRTGSAQHRWSDMRAAASYVVQHPIVGAGLGQDALALNQIRGERWTVVHDVYLQYAVDLGLPGLLLFVALLGSAIRSAAGARRAAAEAGHAGIAAIAEAVWVSLIAFAVAAVFYPAGYHFYFYYFAGLAVAAARVARTLPPRPVVDRPIGARIRPALTP